MPPGIIKKDVPMGNFEGIFSDEKQSAILAVNRGEARTPLPMLSAGSCTRVFLAMPANSFLCKRRPLLAGAEVGDVHARG